MIGITVRNLVGFVFCCIVVSLVTSFPAIATGPQESAGSPDNNKTIAPPPLMPPQGVPNMPPGMPPGMPGMPPRMPMDSHGANEKETDKSGMWALAAKPFRPSWAPLTVFRSDAKAVNYLLPILKSPNSANRARAAFILGQIGDLRAIKPLRALLNDPEIDVQSQAAIALGEMRDGSGISHIAKYFDKMQPWSRCYAVHALWNLHTRFSRSILQARKKNQPPIVAEIIGRAAQTTYTKYPKVKPVLISGKPVAVNAKDIWMQAAGLVTIESDYWWHKGNYNQVIRCLETVVFLDPNDIESYSTIAWLQWSMGQDQAGIHTMNRCIADNPNSAEAFSELAFYYTRSRRWPLAEWSLKKAVELGTDVQTRKTYAHCLEKLGKIQESLAIWTKLKKELPNDGAINNNYLRVLKLSNSQAK